MSDIRETRTKPLILLRNAEDYLNWKSHIISKLQQQNCEWAITERATPNLESVKANLILDGFAKADLSPSTLVSALRDEKKDHLSGLGKAVSIIKDHVVDSLHPLFLGKNAPEMWLILEILFQHISPMSISTVFTDGCMRKLSEFQNAVAYTSSYQATYDKVASLVKEGSCIHMDTLELLLQANMVRNLGPEYSGLVSSIQTEWKEETTNLSDTILRIVRYEEILKESNPKVLLTRAQRAPKGSCTTPECVARKATTHYPDRCWVKHPELRAKYTLRQMRPRGSNRNLKKATTPTTEPTGQAPDATPEYTC